MWTVEGLRAFEESIREAYLTGEVKGALHLSRGNESQLIEIFRDIKPGDWKFSNWRSHYHVLLSGVPEDQVRAEIMAGHSISLHFPEHRFFTSSIVGGCLPIATGVAMAIKRQGGSEQVWCFVGDMAASCGMFHDCQNYAIGFDLPITFVIEDNSHSTNTPTPVVFGRYTKTWHVEKLRYYKYHRQFPHSGYRL